MLATTFAQQFTDVGDACALARGIVDTVHEPILVLDKTLLVIAVSRSFYSAFNVRPEETQGQYLYTLGNGQWDVPQLRVLLEKIIPEHRVIDGFDVEHNFPHLGYRTMRVNACQVFYEGGADTTILLGIEDVTERRKLEDEKTTCYDRRTRCCSNKRSCSRNWSTALPIACKSLPASFS